MRAARSQINPVPAGVTPEMAPVLDRFLQIQLDAHFSRHRFLLGDRPSLGDYGLIAPLYAHIGRDPWSRRELNEPRVHLKSWIERMFLPDSSTGGEFWPDDELPATLLPALHSIFDEMLPFLAACGAELRNTPLLSPDTRTAPRFLGRISYPMAGGTHTRPAPAYPVWMAQRLLEVFAAMTEAERQRVRGWLAETGGSALLSLDLPRVVRVGLSAAHVG